MEKIKNLVQPISGDTDSIFSSGTVIILKNGKIEKIAIGEWYDSNNIGEVKVTPTGHEMIETKDKVLNWDGNLQFNNVNYIIRHMVTKPKWELKTKSGKEVTVTADHSLIVFRDGQKLEVKPYEVKPTDKILIINYDEYIGKCTIELSDIDYMFDEVESVEQIGMFEDEYVYDIEVADESHTFIANDILVHNSLYISYENLIKTVVNEDGSELTNEQKVKFLERLNTEFLDQHNEKFMSDFYGPRHSKQMVQKFELETIALRDIRLSVKKRYAQLLVWKDGKKFDLDEPKFKSKGLEVIKASYPELARKQLKDALYKLLMTDCEGTELLHYMNQVAQEHRQEWLIRPVEDLCENKGINGYTKYILSDNDPNGVAVASKCPYHVRALANRNWTINIHHLRAELQYGGKMKIYPVKKKSQKKAEKEDYFAFMAGEYPEWADEYWPCDRLGCFQKFYLDPLNRVLAAVGIKPLAVSGYIESNLFDDL